jgi:CRISPR-associated endoribonuclease Cas6
MIIAIKVKVYLLRDLNYLAALHEIADFIASALCCDEKYNEMHHSKMYKPYVASSLAPVSADGIYAKDKIYTFTVRCLDPKLAEYLLTKLKDTNTDVFKGLTAECWEVKKKIITRLYSLNPVVIKLDKGGYWKGQISADSYEKIIFTNLIKKYNWFNAVKIDENFQIWTNFKLTNNKPIAIPYKNNISLLGDKLELDIDTNSMAQEIAHMALAVGLGEMGGACCCGYVNYRTVEGRRRP